MRVTKPRVGCSLLGNTPLRPIGRNLGRRPSAVVTTTSPVVSAPPSDAKAAPPPAAKSSPLLSDSELADLVEENRQLRALLETYVDRLAADQVAALQAQYDEIAALAAGHGLQLQPLILPTTAVATPADTLPAPAAAPAVAVAAPPPTAVVSAPRVVEGGVADEVSAPVEEEGQVEGQEEEEDAEHWIDGRGRCGSPDADRLSPQLSAAELAARTERRAALRAEAAEAVSAHDPAAVAAQRHSWLYFTVPERPVAGSDCVLYFNKAQSAALGWSSNLHALVGFNKWQLGGEKLPLTPGAVPSVDGSQYSAVTVSVPKDAFEVNVVFGDDQGAYDNNQGQDFTLPVEGGPTFEEWLDAAADRAARQEAAAAAARAIEEREAAAEALAAALRRDEDAALAAVEDLRSHYASWREGALPRRRTEATASGEAALLWTTQPQPLRAGSRAVLLYNSKAGPLAWVDPAQGHAAPVIHCGFNGWTLKADGGPVTMEPSTAMPSAEDELWWEVSFDVPQTAVALSFCVNAGDAWDNNSGADHKVLVSPPAAFDREEDPAAAWLDSLVPGMREEARQRREAAEAAAAAKAAQRAAERAALRDDAMAVLRRQMRHVMFTEPEVPRAGEKVTVYYSPASTVLNGRGQLYITAGFNRWGHLRKLGPVAMAAPGDGGLHHRATFMVPRDAHVLDLVFSDVPGGDGTYDNRGGLDYHIPVAGAVGAKPHPLHVVHIAVEMAPIAKVGGLGDVVTSLGRAVQDQGHLAEVILPWYQFFGASPLLGNRQHEASFSWGGTHIVVTSCIVEGVRVFFVDPHNGFFATDSVYGRYDDEVRFDFFCKAALEFLLQTQRQPDILHCHDWQTAHVAKAFWDDYQPYGLWKPRVVFTIHNMNYGQRKIAEAAAYSQKFTTVSPSYAFEVGGHPAIAGHSHKFMGILNGIDPELWDPAEDAWLPLHYDADSCDQGKAAARAELRRRLNLSSHTDRPIVAVVSRLTGQKGVHLIKHAAWRARDRGAQFVLLGSAPDPKVQGEFNALAGELAGGYDNNAAFCFCYDEPLSHLIYAAADIVVVPSMFEPCGLTQMIAMRYGAVPVVRHTGGLRDTVFDVDTDRARAAWEVAGSTDAEADGLQSCNGFAFEGTDAGSLDYALNRALDTFYNDREWFRGLQGRVMRLDWSWNRPALNYIDLYFAAAKQ